MNRCHSSGGERGCGEQFVSPGEPHAISNSPVRVVGDDDGGGDSLDPKRGIETLETMLFIETIYRQYFGDDRGAAITTD